MSKLHTPFVYKLFVDMNRNYRWILCDGENHYLRQVGESRKTMKEVVEDIKKDSQEMESHLVQAPPALPSGMTAEKEDLQTLVNYIDERLNASEVEQAVETKERGLVLNLAVGLGFDPKEFGLA